MNKANIEQLGSDIDILITQSLGNKWADNVKEVQRLQHLIGICKHIGKLAIITEATYSKDMYDNEKQWNDTCNDLEQDLKKYLELLKKEIARLQNEWM